jgi:hypothetical protein
VGESLAGDPSRRSPCIRYDYGIVTTKTTFFSVAEAALGSPWPLHVPTDANAGESGFYGVVRTVTLSNPLGLAEPLRLHGAVLEALQSEVFDVDRLDDRLDLDLDGFPLGYMRAEIELVNSGYCLAYASIEKGARILVSYVGHPRSMWTELVQGRAAGDLAQLARLKDAAQTLGLRLEVVIVAGRGHWQIEREGVRTRVELLPVADSPADARRHHDGHTCLMGEEPANRTLVWTDVFAAAGLVDQ